MPDVAAVVVQLCLAGHGRRVIGWWIEMLIADRMRGRVVVCPAAFLEAMRPYGELERELAALRATGVQTAQRERDLANRLARVRGEVDSHRAAARRAEEFRRTADANLAAMRTKVEQVEAKARAAEDRARAAEVRAVAAERTAQAAGMSPRQRAALIVGFEHEPTPDALAKARRRWLALVHPDRVHGPGLQQFASEMAKRINAACDLLERKAAGAAR
jgi:hypothetical protein